METDESLTALNNINIPSATYYVPLFEITSQLTNLPNHSDYDVDENINFNTVNTSISINSQYCAFQDLSSLKASSKEFSLFHVNIRSLPLHHDEIYALKTNLHVDFEVIGLSEIKLSNNSLLNSNVGIPCYKFYFSSSVSSAGGVGFFIKSDVMASKRDYLTLCNNDFDTIWV